MKLQLKLICNFDYVYVSKGGWDRECQQLKVVMIFPWSEFNMLKSTIDGSNIDFENDNYH